MHPQEIVEAAKERQNCRNYSELAEKMGNTKVAICNYRKAARAPHNGDLIKLAELSGIEIPAIMLAFAEHHEKTPAIERDAWRKIREAYEAAK